MCSMEGFIGSINATNRKLEEHAAVGHGFESIAELWGKLSEIMTQAGVPAPTKFDEEEQRVHEE
ncbi:hypothetical protein MVES1_000680 [Malassezia vespertilionis]|uniref:uncharacterized protein n=1 Tax=Malassezia vespertilionis TaxID=2020962 RepID=UPI0024B20CC6|nr:uncharacterized protein MVES1_000680 [Malassezia vespertilionis]WFD05350.1 hypothetical protein MVES1_000680 [Malassezia vespertilionis]